MLSVDITESRLNSKFHFFGDGLRLGFPLIIDARAMFTEWPDIIATAPTSLIRIYIAWVQPLSLGILNIGTGRTLQRNKLPLETWNNPRVSRN